MDAVFGIVSQILSVLDSKDRSDQIYGRLIESLDRINEHPDKLKKCKADDRIINDLRTILQDIMHRINEWKKKGWFTKFFRAKSHFLRGYSKYFDDLERRLKKCQEDLGINLQTVTIEEFEQVHKEN